jgi:hypothetical protein
MSTNKKPSIGYFLDSLKTRSGNIGEKNKTNALSAKLSQAKSMRKER